MTYYSFLTTELVVNFKLMLVPSVLIRYADHIHRVAVELFPNLEDRC